MSPEQENDQTEVSVLCNGIQFSERKKSFDVSDWREAPGANNCYLQWRSIISRHHWNAGPLIGQRIDVQTLSLARVKWLFILFCHRVQPVSDTFIHNVCALLMQVLVCFDLLLRTKLIKDCILFYERKYYSSIIP